MAIASEDPMIMAACVAKMTGDDRVTMVANLVNGAINGAIYLNSGGPNHSVDDPWVVAGCGGAQGNLGVGRLGTGAAVPLHQHLQRPEGC